MYQIQNNFENKNVQEYNFTGSKKSHFWYLAFWKLKV